MGSVSRRVVLTAPAVALAACARVGGRDAGDGSTATVEPSSAPPDVDLSAIEQDVGALVSRVSITRLMDDVRTLAQRPRHVREDTEAIAAAADHISAELSAAGLRPRRIDVHSDVHAGITLPVVWAEIAGSRCSERVFVLTGHYDTVSGSPGADDDASGVAGMLEVARILADAELPGTVVVAGLPFEEDGLPYPASGALGEELISSRGRTVIGMISAEMLGYALPEPKDGDSGDYLMLLGYEGAEDLVHTVAAACDTWVGDFEIGAGTYPPETDFISRSDHAAFHALGVPAAFATDGANFRTPYYHTPEDTPENIVEDFLLGSVRGLVAGVVAVVSVDAGSDRASCSP